MVGHISVLNVPASARQAPAALPLTPGTEVPARVVESGPDNVIRLAIGKETVELKTSAPLPRGTEVTLKVTGEPGSPQIQIIPSKPVTATPQQPLPPVPGSSQVPPETPQSGPLATSQAKPLPSGLSSVLTAQADAGATPASQGPRPGVSSTPQAPPVATSTVRDAPAASQQPDVLAPGGPKDGAATGRTAAGQVPEAPPARGAPDVNAPRVLAPAALDSTAKTLQSASPSSSALQASSPQGPATAPLPSGAAAPPQAGAGTPVQGSVVPSVAGAPPSANGPVAGQAGGSPVLPAGSQPVHASPGTVVPAGGGTVSFSPQSISASTADGTALSPAKSPGMSAASGSLATATATQAPATSAQNGARSQAAGQVNVAQAQGPMGQSSVGTAASAQTTSGMPPPTQPLSGTNAIGQSVPGSASGPNAQPASLQVPAQTLSPTGAPSSQAGLAAALDAGPREQVSVTLSGRLTSAYPPTGGVSLSAMSAKPGLMPTDPQLEAVAERLRPALESQQASIAGAFGQIQAISTAVSSNVFEVSEPLRQVMQQVLGLRLGGSGKIGAPEINQAVRQSGQFLESSLAGGGKPLPGDLKGLLAQMRLVLSGLGIKSAPSRPFTQPAVPSLNAGARGQAQTQATASTMTALDMSPSEMLSRLMKETDSALARIRLTQLVNRGLGKDDGSGGQVAQSRAMDVVVELPLSVGHETAVLQMQIGRDPENDTGDDEDGRAWRLRFGMDLSATGPLEAAVSLRGGATFVSLWIEREETHQALGAQRDSIEAAFAHTGLDLQELRFIRGLPIRRHAAAGATLDRQS